MIEDEKALDRIVFFSDAIFAIAMTLLVLDLRVPILPSGLTDAERTHQLSSALERLAPSMFSFALSFFVIGLLWMTHHCKFRLIRRYDDGLIWLNLAFLFCIAFLPFPTAVLGRDGGLVGTVLYAISITVTGVFSALITVSAYRRHRLIDEDIDAASIRHWMRRTAVVPVVFAISIPIAFASPEAARWTWALAFVLSSSLEFTRRRAGMQAEG
jgi:uncharacterized membrane protein